MNLWQGCRSKTVLQQARSNLERTQSALSVSADLIRGSAQWLTLMGILLYGCLSTTGAFGQQIEFADQDIQTPVLITGERGNFWNQGHYEIWEVEQCVIRHGLFSATGNRAVIWIDRASASSRAPHKVIAYLEGSDVEIHRQSITGFDPSHQPIRRDSMIQDKQWIGRLYTFTQVSMNVKDRQQTARAPSELFQRAGNARREIARRSIQAEESNIRAASFQAPTINRNGGDSRSNEVALGNHRLRIQGRSNVDWSLHIDKAPDGTGTIAVAKSGIRATIEGLEATATGGSGALTIETDNMVVWGPAVTQLQGGELTDKEAPLELYLEGNIIFRQGDRVIYADRMYYNVTEEYGMILSAEILTPVAEYEGLLRVKADVLQQVNKQKFLAYGAAITSSRMGIPTYWFQSDEIEINDQLEAQMDPLTGQQRRDPKTNELVYNHNITAESENNFLFVGGVPIFY